MSVQYGAVQVFYVNMNSLFKNIIIIKQRQTRCSMSILATKLQYTEFGDPPVVVQKVKEKILSPGDGEILAKILFAPVNPADINTIQGLRFILFYLFETKKTFLHG